VRETGGGCRRTWTDTPLRVGKIEVDDAINLCIQRPIGRRTSIFTSTAYSLHYILLYKVSGYFCLESAMFNKHVGVKYQFH
jgi:hypothetical protein